MPRGIRCSENWNQCETFAFLERGDSIGVIIGSQRHVVSFANRPGQTLFVAVHGRSGVAAKVEAIARKDRYVMLAADLLPLMRQLWRHTKGVGYLFPSEDGRVGRHLSPRTIQRAVKQARILAGIDKHATPHRFRHSFATHLIESGTDIRFIQKLLGHTNLETTSLYTKVAQMKATAVASPLDQLANEPGSSGESPVRQPTSRPPVGRMRLEVDPHPDSNGGYAVRLGVWRDDQLLPLPGMRATMPRRDWVALQIPLQDIWEPTLRCLPAAQRERLESPEFFSQVQREVAKRILRIRDAEHSQTIKT